MYRWSNFDMVHPERTTADLINKCMASINPMCAIAGWDVKMIRYCSMHCSNIGILIALNGSLVDLLCERSFFGERKEEQLRELTTRLRRWASANQIEHSQVYITKGMHRRDARGYPELLGKAYNNRVMLAFLAVCMATLAGTCDDLEVQLASSVAQLMSVWHDRLERAPRYMSSSQAQLLDETSMRFVKQYKRLAVLAYIQGKTRWKLIPKVHAWRHLNQCMLSELYNCRFFHAFLDEDNMGAVKRIARMCHRNLLELRVISRLLLRYKHVKRPS